MKMRTSLLFMLLLTSAFIFAQDPISNSPENTNIPFSTNTQNLTVWNGEEYIPFFMNGINLGISVPGTYPGELAASKGEYIRWISKIRELGFNTIRLYTLHYPHFYYVLDSFNLAHPQDPMYIVQGIWLDEEIPGYTQDLYFLSDTMDLMIEEEVDCMHGNRVIPHRWGKAYGTYNLDVSKWVMAYLIGREISHFEILETDEKNAGINSFTGNIFKINNATPSEAWLTERLDKVVEYSRIKYGTERPVCFSSWPTLDPLDHPTEYWPDEDTASVDLSKIQILDAPAGIFVSYHAYPYYPDFISDEPAYQMFSDYLGPNSYLGYLYTLKNHYSNFPLIIAEYGTPSSWGSAHTAHSGMNHGGFNEYEQGMNAIRLLQNIQDAGCGGGIQFAWIDEWFKRTWITDPFDFKADRRILWHNVTAAEQNFGLIGYKKKDFSMQLWEDFSGQGCDVSKIHVGYDYAYLHLTLEIDEIMMDLDEMWISFDTYAPSLGESILPNGETVTNRAEFVMRITNYGAELYVTQAYDLFGIAFENPEPPVLPPSPEQLFHSIPTDGAPWKLVRWKNNYLDYTIDYIGELNAHRVELPEMSNDAVIISNDSINIKIPWSLLQFDDPSSMSVIHDYRTSNWTREDTISDGIAISVFYNGCETTPSTRYTWPLWEFVTQDKEYEKASMGVMENELYQFNNGSIARPDYYFIQQPNTLFVNQSNGILSNDFDLEGNYITAELASGPDHGHLELYFDGSFVYIPDPNFGGYDLFRYRVYDGYDHSDTCSVVLEVKSLNSIDDKESDLVQLYPNPASNFVQLTYPGIEEDSFVEIYNINGSIIKTIHLKGNKQDINISDLSMGIYVLTIISGDENISKKLVVL